MDVLDQEAFIHFPPFNSQMKSDESGCICVDKESSTEEPRTSRRASPEAPLSRLRPRRASKRRRAASDDWEGAWGDEVYGEDNYADFVNAGSQEAHGRVSILVIESYGSALLWPQGPLERQDAFDLKCSAFQSRVELHD